MSWSPSTPPHGVPDSLPEGEEVPPSGARAMGLLRWVVVASLFGAAVYTLGRHFELWGASQPVRATFRCPMHPAVLASQPASCSVCGMDLVAVEARPASTQLATAPSGRRCPIHPEVAGEGGACHVCGERLVEAPHVSPPQQGAVTLDAATTRQLSVRTVSVLRKQWSHARAYPGVVTLDARRVQHVQPRFAGWLERVAPLAIGARVKKGRVLAMLHAPDVVAAQEEMLRTLGTADGWLGTEVSDVRRKLLADSGKRLAALGIPSADIARIQRRRKLERAVAVRAPASGTLLFRGAGPGAFVQPGTELFTLADLSRVWFVVELPARDAPSIRAGQRARIAIEGLTAGPLDAPVAFVSPVANGATGTVSVRFELANGDGALRPGLAGRAELVDVTPNVLVVPSDAVVHSGEQAHVFVKAGAGRFEPRVVRVGRRWADEVEILGGLREGEAIATGATFLLDAESRLHAK